MPIQAEGDALRPRKLAILSAAKGLACTPSMVQGISITQVAKMCLPTGESGENTKATVSPDSGLRSRSTAVGPLGSRTPAISSRPEMVCGGDCT